MSLGTCEGVEPVTCLGLHKKNSVTKTKLDVFLVVKGPAADAMDAPQP
jgi:hypothetical protein